MPDRRESESHVLLGVYRHYLHKARAAVAAPDPRVFMVPEGPGRDALVEQDRMLCETDPAYRRRKFSVANIDRLEEGLPVLIPKWILGGHSWPQARRWKDYGDPEVTMYRMYTDDHLEPVRGESDFASEDEVRAAAGRQAPNRAGRRAAGRRFNL